MSEKISVLIPVYNRASFLLRSVQSILNQTYKNIEVIIYVDGSTDNTLQVAMNLTNMDNRVKVYYETKNKGVCYARNQLLKRCRTKYAIWMDSDDVSHSERIEKQLSAMNDKNRLVYCTWENLKTEKAGTTRGFATLMFPVDKNILFPEDMNFGAEDAVWREKMEEVYPTTDVFDVLYSIDFHGDRIGTWKRKIDKDWNGAYNLEDIKHLSYEEVLSKYNEEHNK